MPQPFRSRCAALALALLACALPAAAQQRKVADVPYVPTPMEAVDVILGLAGVGPQDVVYDLGSGDGRIPIAAARRHGARGLGIDAEMIRTPSTGSVSENARAIREALAKEADGSVVLASLSKGGADVRMALEQDPALTRKVREWIKVCGILHG